MCTFHSIAGLQILPQYPESGAVSFVPIIRFFFHSALTWERYLGWIIVKFGHVTALQISHSWTWSIILELGLPQALFATFTEKSVL
jgi:hypothetical protein